MNRAGLIGVTLTTLAVAPGCESCEETTTDAVPAEKLSVRAAVLEAELTSGDAKVLGVPIRFEVLDDGKVVYTDEATTQLSGRARIDLKTRLDAQALVALVRADAWRATFPGNSTYCSSADDAPFRLIAE